VRRWGERLTPFTSS